MPALLYAHQSDRNLVMDLYAMYLAQCHGIQCHTITSGTIKRHMMAAAAISEAHKQPGTTSPYINKVLDESRRWEAMPNRSEQVMVAILQHMHALCAIQHEDS